MEFKHSYTYRYTDATERYITFVDDNGSQHTFTAALPNQNYAEFLKLKITPEATDFII